MTTYQVKTHDGDSWVVQGTFDRIHSALRELHHWRSAYPAVRTRMDMVIETVIIDEKEAGL